MKIDPPSPAAAALVDMASKQTPAEIMESVIVKGDLSKLSPQERGHYYTAVCHSLGINPLTRPFEYIVLNGKLTLYALRACGDQLRRINGISIEIVSAGLEHELYSVHVRAHDKTERVDEDFGVVALPETIKGEARANAILKAITKAKRRVTLSICGLGFLDETEIEDIPPAAKSVPIATEMNDEIPNFAAEPTTPAKAASGIGSPQQPEAALSIEDMAREAAAHGEKVFNAFYKARSNWEKKLINVIGDELRGLMDGAK